MIIITTIDVLASPLHSQQIPNFHDFQQHTFPIAHFGTQHTFPVVNVCLLCGRITHWHILSRFRCCAVSAVVRLHLPHTTTPHPQIRSTSVVFVCVRFQLSNSCRGVLSTQCLRRCHASTTDKAQLYSEVHRSPHPLQPPLSDKVVSHTRESPRHPRNGEPHHRLSTATGQCDS